VTAGHGIIAGEFFDTGESRTLAWGRRPQTAALVAQLADPERGWEAVVIGEYERAFYGSQYASMAPLFEHYGIQLWMPEVGGQVDWHAEDRAYQPLCSGDCQGRTGPRPRRGDAPATAQASARASVRLKQRELCPARVGYR